MIPNNSSYNSSNPGVSTSSNNVIWQGPDLECIGLCKGDTITDVQEKVAKKLCEVIEQLNLENLDLDCITDCPTCPQPDKSLKVVLDLLIKAFCLLKTRVDNLGGGGTDEEVFAVNLRCLAVTDGSGNILNNKTNVQIIQSVIDQVCANKFDVGNIKLQIDSLQNQIDNLDLTPTVPAINVISQCLFTGTRTIGPAYTLLDSAFCSLRSALGLPADMANAVGKQPTLTNQQLAEYIIDGYIQNPANLAQTVANQWIIITDLLNKVTYMQETCCKTGCEDISVGFEIEVTDPDGMRIVLYYTDVMGTKIPSGWQDAGSSLKVTDEQDRERTFANLDVSQGGQSPELDISGLTGVLTFCLTVKLVNLTTNEQCSKCECRTFEVTDTACPVCRIDNIGTTGTVTIVYQEL